MELLCTDRKEVTDRKIQLGLSQLKPMTMEEYNEKIEQGLKDFQKGKIISHQEMKDEIHKWKTQEI